MTLPAIEFVAGVRDGLGECPLWDAEASRLYWIDSLAPCIRARDLADGRMQHWAMPAPVGSIALATPGHLLAALQDGLYDVDLTDGRVRPVWRQQMPPATRLNDGKADRDGRFVFGTMQVEDDAPPGAVFRFGLDGACEVLAEGIGVANAICFSPDGTWFYLTDSRVGAIWCCDYPRQGRPGPRRVWADVKAITGSAPDGATVDAAGRVWTALVRSGQLACFAPDGSLDRLIDLPVPHPTCPAFGGEGLDVLFVTSIARSRRLHSTHPDAGRMLAITGLDARGLPEARHRAAHPSLPEAKENAT